MIDRFSGDPKIFLGPDGAEIIYCEGQPIMDQGFENQSLISLFTRPGWCGNIFFKDSNEKIGSDFESVAEGTITLNKLNDIKNEGIKALKNDSFGDITGTLNNPVANYIKAQFLIPTPTDDVKQLVLIRNAGNWISQAKNPAYKQYNE